MKRGEEPRPAVVADDGTLVADGAYDEGAGDGERFGLAAVDAVVSRGDEDITSRGEGGGSDEGVDAGEERSRALGCALCDATGGSEASGGDVGRLAPSAWAAVVWVMAEGGCCWWWWW